MKVLFVCVENSCRSQIAEAFARAEGIDAASAGSRPSGIVNLRAIESMRRAGLDLTTHRSKGIEAATECPPGAGGVADEWDYVITMGCGDACPSVPARVREDWPVPDPKAMQPDEFDRVRDDIAIRVKELLRRCR